MSNEKKPRGGMGPGGHPLAGSMGGKKPKKQKETLLRIWQYLKNEKIGLLLVLLFSLIASVFSVYSPEVLSKAFDADTISFDPTTMGFVVNVDNLKRICLTLILLYVITTLATWLQSYIMASVAQNSIFKIRNDVFGKLQTLPINYYDTNSKGDLMSRTTNDIENINNALTQSVTQFLTSVFTVIGVIIMMIRINITLTIVTIFIIPVMLIVISIISNGTRKNFMAQQKELGALNGYIEEHISAQKVIKAYGTEKRTEKEFKDINKRLNKVSIKAQAYSGVVMPLINELNNIFYAVIVGIGGYLAVKTALNEEVSIFGFVITTTITISTIVAFTNYIGQFTRPISQLSNLYNLIVSAIAGAERSFEILDQDSEFEKDNGNKSFDDVKGTVVFDNVNFSYVEGKPILKDINLKANAGDTIALVGPTGAGKTTIINLLTRFYEINDGSITIDGVDLKTIEKNALREKLGIVLQDAYTFSGTIKENIRYGRLDASDEEIIAAAKFANADNFISKLPNGYDTVLTGGGANISQGQRQLLTIARAILANPSILILDEATSSIDTRTEMHLQEAMNKLMEGRTSFVIAHRLSTIREATKILVISDGRIIESGNHDELLKEKGFYYNLYTSQFSTSEEEAV